MRKQRPGARGARKLSTGCLTCKIRHKKCDELRPACSNCVKASWKCDFASSSSIESLQDAITPLIRTSLSSSARPLLPGEHEHMEYFRVICAEEFSIFFELSSWKDMLLQGIVAERSLHHAALAIGAMNRSRYNPDQQGRHVIAFSIRHYNTAIRCLHLRLDDSSQSLELAILASVVFSFIEFLLDLDSQADMHHQAGCAMLGKLHERNDRTLAGLQTRSSNRVGSASSNYDLLANSMLQLAAQFNFLRLINQQQHMVNGSLSQ